MSIDSVLAQSTVTDLDAAADRLEAGGVGHDGVEQATSSRILRLVDPDGNRVVLAGP